MRKILIALLICFCLSLNLFGARTLVQCPQTDSIVNSTDTTGWKPIPMDVDSLIMLAQGAGGAANDSIIGYLDLCGGDPTKVDTADATQIWAQEVSVLVDCDDATVNGTGTYGREIGAFKYFRLIRYSNTATVEGRVWLLWIY